MFGLVVISFGKQSYAQSCMPTCSTVDGRFISITEGAAFETLTGGTLNIRLITPEANGSFTFSIFDGDALASNGNWG